MDVKPGSGHGLSRAFMLLTAMRDEAAWSKNAADDRRKVSAISVYCVHRTAVATFAGNFQTTFALGSPRSSDFSTDCAEAISPGSFLLLAGGVCWTWLAQAMISLLSGNIAVESILPVSF